MILHTLNKTSALTKCTGLIKSGDTVVLLENGVNLLLTLNFNSYEGVNWLAIEADVVARGLNQKVPDGVREIDYQEFVEVTAAATSTCNWF